jgi:hypothetical protein
MFDCGTDPFAATVTVPAPLDVPAHVLAPAVFAKNVYVTVPVAVVVSEVVTVAVSWADDPVVVPDWTTVVAVVLVPLPTVNGSQELVEPA